MGEEILFRAGIQDYLILILPEIKAWFEGTTVDPALLNTWKYEHASVWITSFLFIVIHGYLSPWNWRLSIYGTFMVIASARSLGPHADALPAHGYHRIDKAEPPMRVELAPEWTSFDDYLAAMRPKYRQRARSARKKSKKVTCTGPAPGGGRWRFC